METSPLICSANQWTGFYMISASVMNGLMENFIFCAVVPMSFYSFLNLSLSLLKYIARFSKHVWQFFKIMSKRKELIATKELKQCENFVSCRWCFFFCGHNGLLNCTYFRCPWLLDMLSIYTTKLAFTCWKLKMETPEQSTTSAQN